MLATKNQCKLRHSGPRFGRRWLRRKVVTGYEKDAKDDEILDKPFEKNAENWPRPYNAGHRENKGLADARWLHRG